ncbi:PREDICTED: uncharacterized protein LOC109150757 [Ipomoea nil]|uniref:uncharacterized protein LOC109150757 n=1 Tax=Ipomoea nil TaxID=35883 RepID=UPI000900FA61|nr:PREDICTED: uncharacterized protein LOC109150757 [Ipomoea nil]
MAKMTTNRMKPLIGNLISESHSAFIPGILIIDNILVASEVGHFLNRKQCGKVGWGALKLDMAKAYDMMEWPFLKRMLEVMGFGKGWIDLIMAWRFLSNPTSLAARIYKARYYPATSFIDARMGNCPSYCWRSIMAAHDMACSGVRRRIGNGETNLIWGNPGYLMILAL